jgi:hypothetical protein
MQVWAVINDIFLHEDTSKPENRINLAIFGLMAVPSFRRWMQERLGLGETAVLYPALNLSDGAGRPDFAVKNAESDATVAWIEVECYKDEEQLARFRKSCSPLLVKAIWGKREYGADLSLEEVAEHLSGLQYAEEPQIRYNAEHLRQQIDEVFSGHWSGSAKPTVVSDHVRETSFVRRLVEELARLGGGLSFDISGPMRPREIRANTRGKNGFSLRVYSPVAPSDRSVSVLYQSGGRSDVYFQSLAKMTQYLERRRDVLEELSTLVEQMGGDMKSIELNARTSASLAEVEPRLPALAAIILQLCRG